MLHVTTGCKTIENFWVCLEDSDTTLHGVSFYVQTVPSSTSKQVKQWNK